MLDEPYDLIGHVRICGGNGSVMTVSTRKPNPAEERPGFG